MCIYMPCQNAFFHIYVGANVLFDLFISLKGKHTNRLSLRFVDPELETRYSVEKEKQSGAAFSCSCVVLLFTAAMEALVDPWSVL